MYGLIKIMRKSGYGFGEKEYSFFLSAKHQPLHPIIDIMGGVREFLGMRQSTYEYLEAVVTHHTPNKNDWRF